MFDRTKEQRLKDAYNATVYNIELAIKHGKYEFVTNHFKNASDGDSEVFYLIWDDGTITSDIRSPIKIFDGRRNDLYGPIETTHLWTGSLLATLETVGISSKFKLPFQLLGGGSERYYTCMPLSYEDCLHVRMAMVEYMLFVANLELKKE